MEKQNKALSKAAITIQCNVSAISIGIALYEQKWWAFIIAAITMLVAFSIAWRSEK